MLFNFSYNQSTSSDVSNTLVILLVNLFLLALHVTFNMYILFGNQLTAIMKDVTNLQG